MLRRSTKILGALVLGVVALAFSIMYSAQSSQANSTVFDLTSHSSDSDPMQEKMELGEPASFAFLELFTSEGCSSCPSADQNLARIAAEAKASGKNVYTLSYHVDYWNYMGWKDPYSSGEYSDRQRQYAKQFESSQVYTPQMVVNGQAEFVGSKQKVSDRAVNAALELEARASVQVNASIKDKKVIANWQSEGLSSGDHVSVALVQNEGIQKVNRGENARRELKHINIVRELKTDLTAGKSGTVEFDKPNGFERNKFHVVAFVQSPKNVRAASRSNISANPPKAIKSDTNSSSTSAIQKSERVKTLKPAQQKANLVGADQFLNTLNRDWVTLGNTLAQANQNWDVSYVPMLLEAGQFLPPRHRVQIVKLMETKTRKKLGSDFDKWFQWIWKQKYEPHPEYGKFKAELFKRIDPRFAEYFEETKDSKIRLDEIRWGGVQRDGIPPLKNPKMLTVDQQKYLGDKNVIFGIELNGEARAYPKRILAWHEMFKDTIGGESVCGVY